MNWTLKKNYHSIHLDILWKEPCVLHRWKSPQTRQNCKFLRCTLFPNFLPRALPATMLQKLVDFSCQETPLLAPLGWSPNSQSQKAEKNSSFSDQIPLFGFWKGVCLSSILFGLRLFITGNAAGDDESNQITRASCWAWKINNNLLSIPISMLSITAFFSRREIHNE